MRPRFSRKAITLREVLRADLFWLGGKREYVLTPWNGQWWHRYRVLDRTLIVKQNLGRAGWVLLDGERWPY